MSRRVDPFERFRRRSRLGAGLGGLVRSIVALGVAALVVPPIAGGVAAGTLLFAPLPGELPDERPEISAVPSTVLDRDGATIGVYRGFDRTVEILPEDVPQVMLDAIVAIEDQRFYDHPGVDLEGVVRAARTNLEVGEIAQGGSTITQQYIKNVYLSGEQTFERKFREALLATELERRMTKDEILFAYLESSYYGSGAYGLGAAAELYFGVEVADLDVSQAATLAGVVQAPTRLSPRVDLAAAEARRLLVLQAMVDAGRLGVEEFERHAARELWLQDGGALPDGPVTVVVPPPVKGAVDHPFFVDWVEQQLLDELGEDLLYRGGLTIETSIDSDLQEAAEAAVAARLEGTEFPVDMSLVSLDPATGEVLAMVGGRDHAASQVNLAIGGTTGFQPGSSFKPIVLAAAFERGLGPDTIYPAPADWVMPGCIGTQCTISNYDHADRGDISLAEAMAASVNTVFARLIVDIGIGPTAELANRLGLARVDPEAPYGASLALGSAESSPLEMASAYGTFANHGVRAAPIAVIRVLGPDGSVLIDNTNQVSERVLSSAVADNVTAVLQGVVEGGTGPRSAVAGHPIAGKTGTAQDYTAAWFVGYTPSLVTAVWMGHVDGLAPLRNLNGVAQVTGGSHPAIAFSTFMSVALAGRPAEAFAEPPLLDQFETADDVEPITGEQTVAGPGRAPRDPGSGCGGPCEYSVVPTPALTPPLPTTTTVPGGDPPGDGDATSTTDPTGTGTPNPTTPSPTTISDGGTTTVGADP